MKEIGKYLRKLYIDTKFIKPTYDETEVYVRSSSVKRCIRSMDYLLMGMYPTEYAKSTYDPIPIEMIPASFDRVSLKNDDSLYFS